MKYIIATDDRGYKRRFLVRDADGDEEAASGIPSGPPDLSALDWDSLSHRINNELADRGLWTWDDIQKSPEGLQVIASVVKQYVAVLFKEDYALAKASQSRRS